MQPKPSACLLVPRVRLSPLPKTESSRRNTTAAGVAVALWRSAETEAELASAVAELGVPVIAKTARFGYDGKGRCGSPIRPMSLRGGARRRAPRRRVGHRADRESASRSLVVDGDVVDHGVMENTHANHILDTTTVPARVPDATAEAARETAHLVATGLGLVGVLCVELFDTAEGILVNEIALVPTTRHCTTEAAAASRSSSCGRSPASRSVTAAVPAAMAQLLGDLWDDGEPDWTAAPPNPCVHLHLYERARPHGPKDGASHGGR